MIYLLELSCGHKAVTEVELKLQYSNDTHMILCHPCRETDDVYGRTPTAWNEVTSYTEAFRNVTSQLLYVLKRDAFVLPRDIMRLQPKVPRNRIRPFPYVRRRH